MIAKFIFEFPNGNINNMGDIENEIIPENAGGGVSIPDKIKLVHEEWCIISADQYNLETTNLDLPILGENPFSMNEEYYPIQSLNGCNCVIPANLICERFSKFTFIPSSFNMQDKMCNITAKNPCHEIDPKKPFIRNNECCQYSATLNNPSKTPTPSPIIKNISVFCDSTEIPFNYPGFTSILDQSDINNPKLIFTANDDLKGTQLFGSGINITPLTLIDTEHHNAEYFYQFKCDINCQLSMAIEGFNCL